MSQQSNIIKLNTNLSSIENNFALVVNEIKQLKSDLGAISFDNSLSLTSTNPLQNKVVTEVISDLSVSINMDLYLDMLISGNYSSLPIVIQNSYSDDLNDIIGGTYT